MRSDCAFGDMKGVLLNVKIVTNYVKSLNFSENLMIVMNVWNPVWQNVACKDFVLERSIVQCMPRPGAPGIIMVRHPR